MLYYVHGLGYNKMCKYTLHTNSSWLTPKVRLLEEFCSLFLAGFDLIVLTLSQKLRGSYTCCRKKSKVYAANGAFGSIWSRQPGTPDVQTFRVAIAELSMQHT